MKKIIFLSAVMTFCGCSGIAFNKSPVIKEEEASAMTFQYPKKDVFDACLTSLQANGWTVTASNYETGAISGIRRPFPGTPAEAAPEQHSATVSVVEKEAGRTEVKIVAGISSPNPGGEAKADAVVIKNLPRMCAPLLNSVQETLLKGQPAVVK